jgi:hypothetical protein
VAIDLTLAEFKDAKQQNGQRQQNGTNECQKESQVKAPKGGLNEG